MRRLLTAPLVAVLALSVTGGPGEVERAEAASRMCSNTYGGDVISARNLSCRKAKRIVRTWARRYKRDDVVNRRVLGFRCRDRSDQYEGLVVRCTRGTRSVRFYANVP